MAEVRHAVVEVMFHVPVQWRRVIWKSSAVDVKVLFCVVFHQDRYIWEKSPFSKGLKVPSHAGMPGNAFPNSSFTKSGGWLEFDDWL